MVKVHFTEGDGKGWALDEDLRQIRSSLNGLVRETSAAGADVIHAPFWQNLSMVAPELLRQAYVIAHADNPPFFYLTQPEFAAGQTRVDLWVARSREAFDQFTALRLPVVHIPYAIDEELFFPIPDKSSLRRKFGVPEGTYVIANFHRDSEGADLHRPKTQKAPELMVAVLKRLRDAGASFHVLLAGPRRHWIRNELQREHIPFTFVGRQGVEQDDFGINILGRTKLNELYNTADLYLIPSRWEGGPQSAMEAAACRCKLLSTPLGVARDILDPSSLMRSAAEGAERILEDMRTGNLDATVSPQFNRWKAAHTLSGMSRHLRDLYASLGSRPAFQAKIHNRRIPRWRSAAIQAGHTLRRRLTRPGLPSEIFLNHAAGHLIDLDEVMDFVRMTIGKLGIRLVDRAGAAVEIIGWPARDPMPSGRHIQWVVPGLPVDQLVSSAILVAPSVQDILNLRNSGYFQPALAVAVPFHADGREEEPLLVEPDDLKASVRIWRAMAGGRPVVYPEVTGYYEQVFHAGVAFSSSAGAEGALKMAAESAAELRSFARLPAPESVSKLIEVLVKK